jgi:peroxiredoxin
MKLKKGDPIIPFEATDIYGNPISTDDYKGEKLMIAFFRYAECLFCNLRVHQLQEQSLEFEQKGLKLIAVFQSPAEDIKTNLGDANPLFPIIPDVKRELYKQYGVEYSLLGLLKGYLRWIKVLRAFSRGHYVKRGVGSAKIIPADFLINPDQTVHTAFYGNDISEHLPLKHIKSFLE